MLILAGVFSFNTTRRKMKKKRGFREFSKNRVLPLVTGFQLDSERSLTFCSRGKVLLAFPNGNCCFFCPGNRRARPDPAPTVTVLPRNPPSAAFALVVLDATVSSALRLVGASTAIRAIAVHVRIRAACSRTPCCMDPRNGACHLGAL